MIPRTRLLVWSAAWLLPLAGVAAAVPALAPAAYGLAALAMLVPVFDAVRAGRSVEGLSLEAPERVRLTKGAPGTVSVRVRDAQGRTRRVRVGVPLPENLGCDAPEATVRLTPDAPAASVELNCLPVRRGRHDLTRGFLGAPSPMGFWLKRREVELPGEVRVYPSLAPERRRLSALFLTRGSLGIHAQRQIGQGREFEKLRDYVPGDNYGDIHWKATAKRHRPATKVFQIERTQEVYVALDASRLSARVPEGDGATGAGAPPTMLERFVTAAMVLGMVAERQGDLFGVLSFADRVEQFVRAKGGKAHYSACRDALYALQPRAVTPDFSELFTFLRLHLRRRALLVFLMGLDDAILAESFVENVSLIARQHLVLVNMIQPPGVRPVFSDPAAGDVNDVYRDLSGHVQWRRLREVEKSLRRRGVNFHVVENASFCPHLVTQYVSVKRRQLL